jgi:hypothetical protein
VVTNLQEDPFQCHDLFSRINPECIKLAIIGELSHCPDDVSTLLWGLFSFPRKKETAGCHWLQQETLSYSRVGIAHQFRAKEKTLRKSVKNSVLFN